jgi:hypothetical protein
MSSSSVGVTDIHTPSRYVLSMIDVVKATDSNTPVVLIALPANEVSTRWLSAKLFPTDCSPKDNETQPFGNMSQIAVLTHRRNNFHRLRLLISNGVHKYNEYAE